MRTTELRTRRDAQTVSWSEKTLPELGRLRNHFRFEQGEGSGPVLVPFLEGRHPEARRSSAGREPALSLPKGISHKTDPCAWEIASTSLRMAHRKKFKMSTALLNRVLPYFAPLL
jgi:hypothetical protein